MFDKTPRIDSHADPDSNADADAAGMKRVVMLVAAPREVEAVLLGLGHDESSIPDWSRVPVGSVAVSRVGVGKANAAGAAGLLIDPDECDLVVSLGVAGALPGGGCEVGDVVIATSSVLADEGIQTPSGFQSLAEMGFASLPDGSDAIAGDPRARRHVAGAIADMAARLDVQPAIYEGVIATVSTCAGTDLRAQQIRAQTGAIAEAMEGAAVGLVAQRLGVAFLEVRVISNTTGDRDSQRWDLDRALTVLGSVAQAVADGSRTC